MSEQTKKPTWSSRALALWALLGDRPLAYHPLLARALGDDIPSAIFLTQLIYWTGKGTWRPGWTVKSQVEFYDETALTRYQQERARRKLGKDGLKVISEKRAGVPARLMYRVHFGRLSNILSEYLDQTAGNSQSEPEEEEEEGSAQIAGNSQSRVRETDKQDSDNPPDKAAGNSQPITETTTETTQETTTETSVSQTRADKPDLDKVFPESTKAKNETVRPDEPMTPEEAADMAAPGAGADMTPSDDSHPAYAYWKTHCANIGFPHGLTWTQIFDYAVMFADLSGIATPMNKRDIGQWRVGVIQCMTAFAETMKQNGRPGNAGTIYRRAAWGLQVFFWAREHNPSYQFNIVSPLSVAKTLRAIAGDLSKMETDLGLDSRLPQIHEIADWYERKPGVQQKAGATLTEQSLANLEQMAMPV